jgi:hypothetical protein
VVCPEGDGEDLAPPGEDLGDGVWSIGIEGDLGMKQGDERVGWDALDERRYEERGGRKVANRTDWRLYRRWGTEVRGRLGEVQS